MRVPVLFPLQVVHVGPGVRRATLEAAPPRRRLHGLSLYGGDVRERSALSLVFHGNLGQDAGLDPVAQTYELSAPVSDQPIYEPGVFTSQFPSSEPVLTDTTPIYTPGVFTSQLPTTTPPVTGSSASDSWWQILPAITGTAGAIVQAVRAAVSPGSAAAAGPTSYTIPATATTPAYRVTYNPATGQMTQGPVTTAPSALPSFLQAAPGAAWYQNPMVLLGGGLVGVLLLVMASRR